MLQCNRRLEVRRHEGIVQEKDMTLLVTVNLLQIVVKIVLETCIYEVCFCIIPPS